MPITKVYEGKVERLEILNKDGRSDGGLDPKLPKETLYQMYRSMNFIRLWDRKCMALQRTGRMYTYAPLEGQEAIIVGSWLALSPEDWIFPTYRESILYHLRGEPLSKVNLIWMGMEDGLKLEKKLHNFPHAIPIGTQLPHAVGAAYALRMNQDRCACLAYGGDGATSEGDFHDALNFAGVFNVPVVFLISNNQWAISTPRKLQTKSETIAQKAIAYGFKGIQVDGNDIFAVNVALKNALENAKNGKGPMLIEAVTYRMGPHTTSDDPKKYRSEEEVAYWRERDPIMRLQTYMKAKGLWSPDYEKRTLEEATKEIEAAVDEAERHIPDPKDLFGFVFAKTPTNVKDQLDECFGGSR